MKKRTFVEWLYETKSGRVCLKVLLYSGALKLGEMFVRSTLSKPLINIYIHNNRIDMRAYKGQKFRTFQEFFSRNREDIAIDMEENHVISPCDGYLSAYPIRENSRFFIKGSWYKVKDLVTDSQEANAFRGGQCVIVRLCAEDYHHYCYIDDGFQRENHFVKGILHSVQPVACENEPVYRLNRRMWNILETKHFGKVAQIEIGALLVGGMVNEGQNVPMQKGKDMGHFELIGSTIVLLFEKDAIELLPEVKKAIAEDKEMRVLQGQHIGNKKTTDM